MEKTKLLTIAVIGLLVINFGTLGFLLLNGKGHRPPQAGRQKPKEIIIEKLHFDEAQQKDYAKLIKWHRGEITKLDGNIREAKNELYSQLLQPETNLKAKDSLISVINLNQKQIEIVHLIFMTQFFDVFKMLEMGLFNLFLIQIYHSNQTVLSF